MAVDPGTRSLRGSARTLLREGSYRAFFRGLGPSLLGNASSEASLAGTWESLKYIVNFNLSSSRKAGFAYDAF